MENATYMSEPECLREIMEQAQLKKDPAEHISKLLLGKITKADLLRLVEKYVKVQKDDVLIDDIKGCQYIVCDNEVMLKVMFLYFCTTGIHIFPENALFGEDFLLRPDIPIISFPRPNKPCPYVWIHIKHNAISLVRHNLSEDEANRMPIIRIVCKRFLEGKELKDIRASLHISSLAVLDNLGARKENSLYAVVNISKYENLVEDVIVKANPYHIVLVITTGQTENIQRLVAVYYTSERYSYFLHY